MNILAKDVTVIGDCHGCYKTLLSLVDKIKAQFPDTEIAFCGDLVDRGPSSREVVEYVMSNRFPCVKGNHELMMYEHYNNTSEYPGTWLFSGGAETIESYKDKQEDILRHCTWMENLPLFLEFRNCKKDDRYLVVSHSSVGKVWDWSESKRQKNKKQFEQIILWDRGLYEDRPDIFNIHGHSPCGNTPTVKSFYANVDTGCVFKRASYGFLSAIHYPSMTIIRQENIE